MYIMLFVCTMYVRMYDVHMYVYNVIVYMMYVRMYDVHMYVCICIYDVCTYVRCTHVCI